MRKHIAMIRMCNKTLTIIKTNFSNMSCQIVALLALEVDSSRSAGAVRSLELEFDLPSIGARGELYWSDRKVLAQVEA